MTNREMLERCERITISELRPHLSRGRYAPKRILHDTLQVTAVILKEGHDLLAAELRLQRPGADHWDSVPLHYSFPDDEWSAEVPLDAIGRWSFTVAAWTDQYASWLDEFRRKVAAGLDVESETLEGAALLRLAAEFAGHSSRHSLEQGADALESAQSGGEALVVAESAELGGLAAEWLPRRDLTVYDPALPLMVDRPRARFGAWYELFIRSQGTEPGRPATFRDAEARLPEISAMGFDVLYLAPIHPIGETNRKGRNNSLRAEPGDPGSPWAIGNQFGGHDAVNPELGTIDDFDHFVTTAAQLGMEIALDFAIQCSPDHPYVHAHPEWFRRRPDGTVKYAENPPKRYEDIVALDMWCEDYPALWEELLRVVRHWVSHGVRIFRVDNPHTKPIAFWEWLIAEVQRDHPDVLFLAEAFTRPKKLQELAKVGFTQSYTYFTWRNTRPELEEFLTELTKSEQAEYLRPNFFANTPDILHEYLQTGGTPAFKVRAILAGTLSPTYGIYSGYELIENVPLHPGSEEYLDSEKYEVRVRDWNAPGNIKGYLQRLNSARRDNAALQLYTNLTFHDVTNPAIIAYSKATPDLENRILVLANLDPFAVHETMLTLDGELLGITDGEAYAVHDLLTGYEYSWRGITNYVRLDPAAPVHLFRIDRL